MAQILVQIPDQMLADLEAVAPGSSRKRSQFIRLALQKALMEVRDVSTVEAYRRQPDDGADYFDPREWAEWKPRAERAKKKSGKR